MDNIQDRIIAMLPTTFLDTFTSHSGTYWSIYKQGLAISRQISAIVTPIVSTTSSLITNLFYKLASAPDVATVVLLLVILMVSIYVLDMIYRTVLWWIRMTVRLLFWGVLIAAGWYLYLRGIDGVVDDMNGIVAFWQGEYERFSREAEVASRMAKQGLGQKPQRRGFGGKARNPWG